MSDIAVEVEVYTDGSCNSNPGNIGSWCFAYTIDSSSFTVISGVKKYISPITSIVMELHAFYMSIKYLEEKYGKSNCKIYTDSMYVVNIYNGIYSPKMHIAKWSKIFAIKRSNFKVIWVKSHAGCYGNVLVDSVVRSIMRGII